MSGSVSVPKMAILDNFVDVVTKNQGISLEEVGAGRALIVETQNSTYTIDILNSDGTVLVIGGTHFPNLEVCILLGSTVGNSLLKMRWIGLGMCMEFHKSNGQRIITSSVKTISFPGIPSHQVH